MANGLFTLKQQVQALREGAWSGYIAPKWVEYLVVAGGGGGNAYGSGGGGGGLLTGIVTVAYGTSYTVTVGAGGTVNNAGVNSSFSSITALGGGASASSTSGSSGGSGSGGTIDSAAIRLGGAGTVGQGNYGGNGNNAAPYPAGGGGGAGSAGLNGTLNVSGNGGAGIASAISGTVTTYSGGGGGGIYNNTSTAIGGSGGVGGGGNGGAYNVVYATAGGANTGGGGGGANYPSAAVAAAGGSGVVIVRYPGTVQFFTGGTLSYANGYMIHTFYASGTLAPTTPTVYIDTPYQISRSLRFNAADSAYLNRTLSASNRKTWTWSGWVKRSAFTGGSYHNIFQTPGAAGGDNDYFSFRFMTGDQIGVVCYSYFPLISTQVFRDTSAWYHLVCTLDTTQPIATNRLKIYVNGSEITQWGTDNRSSILSNATLGINSAAQHNLGAYQGSSEFFPGYMTEINFIDGQALTPSAFGYTNPTTGVWAPHKFVGTYGTNGFYLKFADNSNTTAATLGADSSGNGNNWTPNNFSVTAGAGNDSLVDTPTQYGTDTGVGGEVRGNYATFNPIGGVSNPSTLTNGNLDVTTPATGVGTTVSTIQIPSSGQYYCEITFVTDAVSAQIGIVDFATVNTNMPLSPNCVTYASSGVKYVDGTSSSYGSSYTTGDIIGLAINADTGSITFYKNNTSQGAITHAVVGLVIGVCDGSNSGGGSVFTGNFGQRPFAYTAPSGFKALCTQNLPTPTIGATASTLAPSYFNPVTYTGTGATQSVLVGFQPDFVWIKNRTLSANWHVLTDSVRGVQKEIYTNSTSAEATLTTSGVNQFNSSGFQILGGTNDYNGSTSTYVAWNWKASNATAVTNASGSITSQVSANPTSGFSVVTYTGTGANATIGHGLGVAPSMIISKSRSNALDWDVYHSALGPNYWLRLNSTIAAVNNSAMWRNVSPTSTVWSIGTDTENNTNGATYVAYCFAEVAGYSKFGSYTGNASSDGPFVYTGFKPAYVMVKRTSSTGDFFQYNNKSSPYNIVDKYISLNVSSTEGTYSTLDFLSNGFKLRVTDAEVNGNGSSFIFMAFAEAPTKFSLAR